MHDDEFLPQSANRLSLSAGTGGGLAGLLIGCTLLVSACALMVFNIVLFSYVRSNAFRDIPRELAQLGGIVGVAGVVALGVAGLASGIRGWSAANRGGESNSLGVAGTLAGGVGLVAWTIAGIDLIFILFA